MKIFAAGLSTETNTFSPISTGLQDFKIQWGRDAAAGRVDYPMLDLSSSFGKWAKEGGHEFVFGLMAMAQPSGLTARSAYESLRDKILHELRAALPVDVVLLSLHGAMVAQGYDDCEADLIACIRSIVGSETVIGVELDLHCHLSGQTIEPADIVITYKEYPHIDINARARELFDLAIQTRQRKIRPTMALFDCRMVGLYPTSSPAMRRFIENMIQAEQRSGVLSVSFVHGFQHGDVPYMGGKMLVVTDNDKVLAETTARELGMQVFSIRHEIGFDSLSLPLEEALTRAMASDKTPVVVADQSDNAGGGAPGDATYALTWLLEHNAKDVAMGIFYDPQVVKLAQAAGVGAKLQVRLGGKLGVSSGNPVDITVTVLALEEGYLHAFPQQDGEPMRWFMGDVAALRCGGIDMVVSTERGQCFCPSVFSDLGIDPTKKKMLIPKSTQHFYGAFAPIAGEVIYMAGPGAVSPIVNHIPYRRVDTDKLYPWVENPHKE